MPFIGPIKVRECRLPHSGDALGEECRMPFFGPLKGRERRIPRSGDTQGRSAKLMLRQRQAAFSSLKNPIF